MAFHVACPITRRMICHCALGPGDGIEDVAALEEFLRDTWTVRVGGEAGTVQVRVPPVVPQQRKPARPADDGEEVATRSALQRQAAAASVAAEDYVRKLEIRAADVDLLGAVPSSYAGEDQGSSSIKVICRICFSGENEGSFKAQKKLPCKKCNKKYHKSCLKSWAEHRDLFHWSSWACPSCRTCEACESTGDPNKLTFCRRCDGAFHCYCQQPPHKNVSHGPYVCPKHTRCHSCGSTVPGNGPSTRWFLGYTCCDACGRLFVKGNYCPVCLKVYRDSEMTPMVCCDICERWIHCACDGISDEKYQQFQVDHNLQYTCAACRGDCYQVRDTDDAVRELWKRKDIAEHKLIASLRAAAGLPSQEDISADSDDGQSSSIISKNDCGRSLKFSVKGLSDKLTNNYEGSVNAISKDVSLNKNHSKKTIKFVSNAEGSCHSYQKQNGERSRGSSFRIDGPESKHGESSKYNSIKEFGVSNFDKLCKIETDGWKLQGSRFREGTAKMAHKNETVKGTKLVIHLGSKHKNVSSSPMSETSSCHIEQDSAAPSVGNEDITQPKINDRENHMHEAHGEIVRSVGKGAKLDTASLRRSSKHGGREENVIKLEALPDKQMNKNDSVVKERQLMFTCTNAPANAVGAERSNSDDDIFLRKKQPPGSAPVDVQTDMGHHTSRLKFSGAASNDPKPLLKLKFKNPYVEQRTSWASQGEEENPVKGQRSKRKRPSAFEKVGSENVVEESSTMHNWDNPLTDQEMEANWILRKLGNDAIGKRVEVHQLSNNSWQKGVVSDVTIQRGSTSSSSLLVLLDNGRSTTLDLAKQAVRFAPQKQNKRAKTRQ